MDVLQFFSVVMSIVAMQMGKSTEAAAGREGAATSEARGAAEAKKGGRKCTCISRRFMFFPY
jgi:hypothetical protein